MKNIEITDRVISYPDGVFTPGAEQLVFCLRYWSVPVPGTALPEHIARIMADGGDEIVRLTLENWQLKGALGYPVPGGVPESREFKCGICDARSKDPSGDFGVRQQALHEAAFIARQVETEQEADYTFGNAQFGDGWCQAAEKIAEAIEKLATP